VESSRGSGRSRCRVGWRRIAAVDSRAEKSARPLFHKDTVGQAEELEVRRHEERRRRRVARLALRGPSDCSGAWRDPASPLVASSSDLLPMGGPARDGSCGAYSRFIGMGGRRASARFQSRGGNRWSSCCLEMPLLLGRHAHAEGGCGSLVNTLGVEQMFNWTIRVLRGSGPPDGNDARSAVRRASASATHLAEPAEVSRPPAPRRCVARPRPPPPGVVPDDEIHTNSGWPAVSISQRPRRAPGGFDVGCGLRYSNLRQGSAGCQNSAQAS